jgi:hypothetical protein
VASHED